MHLPTLVYLAPAGVCALSWLGVGLGLPQSALSGEPLLDWLTRVGVGSVAIALLVLALGRAHLLDRRLLIGLTLAGALVGASAIPALIRAVRGVARCGRLIGVLLGAVAVALVLDLAASTAPITSADALKYHVALPKLWLQFGSIGDPFWRWEGFGPSGVEMLYAQGLALGGASAAAPLHAVFAAFCALAIFGLGRELGGSALAGAVAAFLFVLQGIVTWEATSAFIELGLTFYIALALWHVVRWAGAASRRAAGWTGFFVGAAAGTKYLGLVATAIVLVDLSVLALARRRPLDAAIASAAALLAGGAWYLKNALATGNPVYPLLFGGKWLTHYADHLIRDSLRLYGVGGGLWRLVLLPFDLIAHGGAFDRGQYVGTAIFVLALLTLLTRRTAVEVVLVAGVIVYAVVWWEESPQARFLLPCLAVLAAVAGAGSGSWLRTAGLRRNAVLVVLGCSALAWAAASIALTRQLLPVTVGAEAKGAFLQRLTGTYEAFTAARARTGSGTVGLAGYPFAFNFPGRAVAIDIPEFVPTLSRGVYLSRLRSLGVRTILVGGGRSTSRQLDPVRGCLTKIADYRARYVTSRSLGRSTPYDLALYSLVRCTP
jgi:hypothetical protein